MITTIVSTALIIIKTVMKMSSGMKFDTYYCIELAGIFIISVTSYLMIYYHCKIRKEKTILEVQNKLLEADKKMLIITEQAIEEMRSLRHDMKNQNKVMQLMLEEGRYDDLKEYFFLDGKELYSFYIQRICRLWESADQFSGEYGDIKGEFLWNIVSFQDKRPEVFAVRAERLMSSAGQFTG